MKLNRWAGVGVVLLLAACGDNPTGVQNKPVIVPDSISVILLVPSPVLFPGDDEQLSVEVKTPKQATSVYVLASGDIVDSLDLPVPRAGDFGYYVTYHIPRGFIGSVHIKVVARLAAVADTATGQFTIVDDGNPTIELYRNAGPTPGDSMKIGFIVRDHGGIQSAKFRVQGGLVAAQDRNYALPYEVAEQFVQLVPRSSHLGDSIFVNVTVTDAFGNTTIGSMRLRLEDLIAPTIRTTLSGGRYDSLTWRNRTHFTGDTIVVLDSARDNFALRWNGWRIIELGLGDSVLVSDTLAVTTFRIPVNAAFDGAGRTLEVFTRDTSGNRAATVSPRDFVDGNRRAFRRIVPTLGGGGISITDSARGRLYTGGVNEIDMDNFTLMSSSPITTTNLWGFGSNAAGDSVLVAVALGPTIHLLSTGPPLGVAKSITIPSSPGASYPAGLALVGGGRALVSWGIIGGVNPHVTFVNLATGQTTDRNTSELLQPGLVASPDRRWVATIADASRSLGPAERVAIFDVAADSFGPGRQILNGYASFNRDGSLLLIGNRLYDRGLNLLKTVGGSLYDQRQTLLSLDGQYMYVRYWPGLHVVRVSDGALVEKIYLPDADYVGYGYALVELPGRQAIVTGSDRGTFKVDLSPGGILP